MTKARKEERDRLNELAKNSENQAKSLKRYLLTQLERLDMKRVDGKTHKLSLRAKPAQLVIHVDPEDIPRQFVQVEYKPDKTAIKQHLKANNVDWATLEKPDERTLMIK